MAKKTYPPHIQAMLDKIKKAKTIVAEQRELEQSTPTKFELKTIYTVGQVEQELTLALASISDLGAWKESERFLKELFTDDDYSLVSAEITEYKKTRFITTDYFYIWR